MMRCLYLRHELCDNVKPFVQNDSQQTDQVFMLQLPETSEFILKTLTLEINRNINKIHSNQNTKSEVMKSSHSRHHRGLLQEGLSCDITFNGLYCHPLAHILSFINSWDHTSEHTLTRRNSFCFFGNALFKINVKTSC